MNETEIAKLAFTRGAMAAAEYLGEELPPFLIDEAFEEWLAELDAEAEW